MISAGNRSESCASFQRDDGERFTVRADEKLTAFVEPESVVRAFKRSSFNETKISDR